MARLYSFQRREFMSRFESSDVVLAEWRHVDPNPNGRLAYDYARREMQDHGLAIGLNPPIWAWEIRPDELSELADALYSDFEKSTFSYVTVTLDVPEEMILRSSYHGWCDLYLDCLETGEIQARHGQDWLNWQAVDKDGGDCIQVLLPCLHKDWVRDCSLLHFEAMA